MPNTIKWKKIWLIKHKYANTNVNQYQYTKSKCSNILPRLCHIGVYVSFFYPCRWLFVRFSMKWADMCIVDKAHRHTQKAWYSIRILNSASIGFCDTFWATGTGQIHLSAHCFSCYCFIYMVQLKIRKIKWNKTKSKN